MEYIRVFAHKEVKTDKVYSVLKLLEIAEAEKIDDRYFLIKSGNLLGEKIPLLDKFYKDKDYVCDILPPCAFLIAEGKYSTLEELNEILLKIAYPIHFYYLEKIDKKIMIRECFDDNIVKSFDNYLSPSINSKVGELIDNSLTNGNGCFQIPAELKAQMIDNNTNLVKDDTKNSKNNFMEYDIVNLYENLRKKIVGLDNELKQILTHIIKNISASYSSLSDDKIRGFKSTILILGHPGTGKTLMIESIAELLDVPVCIADASRYTPNGFEGENIEDMLLDLYRIAGEDIEKFEHGVIFIDEFDKLCKVDDFKLKNLKDDVQKSLLRIIQGTTISKKIRVGFSEKIVTLNTSKITFVLSGVFNEVLNMEGNIQNNLISYGLQPELADRISFYVKTHMPTIEDLENALKNSSNSYIKILKEYLNYYGIDMVVDEEFIQNIAKKVYESNQSYRGLAKITEEYISEKMFDIISGKEKSLHLKNK